MMSQKGMALLPAGSKFPTPVPVAC